MVNAVQAKDLNQYDILGDIGYLSIHDPEQCQFQGSVIWGSPIISSVFETMSQIWNCSETKKRKVQTSCRGKPRVRFVINEARE